MNEPLEPIFVEWAVDQVLGDVDTFTDYISGECYGMTSVSSDYESRKVERLLNAEIPTVVAALLRAADNNDAEVCLWAASILKNRFLNQQDERVRRLASEAAMEHA